MRVDRIALENFKCYGDAELALSPGVTVIHGPNGSGKSSLLEACFFALYGSRALDAGQTLEDVVSNGADACRVELAFTHAGGHFRVEREVKVRSEGAQTATCTLEAPDAQFAGATDVRRRVTELLRMDEAAFVNCAYVRQGEVNKLIHASPGERQVMIDDLLQLGKLEEYRERARAARLAVQSVRDGKRDVVENLDEQIAEKEEADLHARLNEVEAALGEVDGEIDRYEANREQARETLSEAEDVLAAQRERREELEDVRERVDELKETVADTEREREELRDRVVELGERREELAAEREDRLVETDLDDGADADAVGERLDELAAEREGLGDRLGDLRVELRDLENEAESLEGDADDLDERAAEARAEADDLDAAADEQVAGLEERREQLADLEAEIDEQRAAFEGAPVAFGDAEDHRADLEAEREALANERSALEVEVETLRERVAEAERLLEEGRCPECGQPVEDSPHVDGLEDDREDLREKEAELAALDGELEALGERVRTAEELVAAEREVETLCSRVEDVESLVDDREAAVAQKRERAGQFREEADELEADAAAKREAAAETREERSEVVEDVEAIEAELEELDDRVDRLEAVRDLDGELADLDDEIERLRAERESRAELNEERRERLSDLRARRDQLEDAYDEDAVEVARAEKERAEDYLERVEPKLEELRERRDDLQSRRGGVRNQLAELEELRERREDVVAELDRIERLHGEAEQLEATYGDLRAELRQRNVSSLERMLNETFDLVYRNDSYARIELDGDYELTVYQKDDEPLDPEQLSGGERALFNLSLRCAIYRLLAEGIEGAAPMPPLVLDEPTVFLDSGHVGRLVELVGEMRDLGVEQIVVVSHDDELVGAADDLVRVHKDPTTNRSSVEHAEAVGPGTLAAGDD